MLVTYQRLMNAILHDMLYDYIEDYVDVTVRESRKVKQRVDDLRKFFVRADSITWEWTPWSVPLVFYLVNSLGW